MQQSTPSEDPGAAGRIRHAPLQLTPFFGRQLEVDEIVAYLADPHCRLLTLTGPGGVGKTRLAVQAATRILARFPHGVWFVSLQAVSAHEALITAVADVVGCRMATSADPQTQLCAYLADKALLLILDNFEQLIAAGGADVLSELIDAAPALKLLVTSREALKLQQEWCYPLGGMPVPSSAQAEGIERYAVVRLFVDRARRVRSDFSLATERAGLVRLCTLVEGLPLAVELAASWTAVLSTETIADEIVRNLHFLQTDLRDVPDRHRSIHAVFSQSWSQLTPDERDIFQRLAVFRGGFGREAAEQVAGATLPILAALVRQSLLSVAPDGRYHIHELLRQYAAERLSQAAPELALEAGDRHCLYYTTFLRDHNADMNGGQQLKAIAEIAAELDNVRAAWLWAIERRNIPTLLNATNALYLFCQFRGRYAEGVQQWELAVRLLDDQTLQTHPDASLLLYALGWLTIRLGRLEEARAHFERCYAAYRHLARPPTQAHASDPRLGLGLLAALAGDYSQAQHLLEQVSQASKRDGHAGNRRAADYFLAGIHRAQGRYAAAHQHAQAAYALAQNSHDRWFMAYCLHELGHAARALGALDQARRYYQTSYSLREEFGDPGGMAAALTHLGAVALHQGQFEMAEDCYQRSLTIYREIADQGGLVTALDGLGQAARARGRLQLAARHLGDALRLAAEARFVALRLALLISIGELLLSAGSQEWGRELLRLVRRQLATTHEARGRVERLLDQAGGKGRDFPRERSGARNLEELTAELHTELASIERQDPLVCTDAHLQQPAAQALVEPLTPREQELVQLLAAGLSYEEIARRLSIAVGTVKAHAHSIYGKLGVRNRVQAAARAVELGLLR